MLYRQTNQIKLLLLVGDFISLCFAAFLTSAIQTYIVDRLVFSREPSIALIQQGTLYFYIILWIIVLQRKHLYGQYLGRVDEFLEIFKAGILTTLIFGFMTFVFKIYELTGSRIFWVILWINSIIIVFVFRRLYYSIFNLVLKTDAIRKRVLIYGYDDLAKDVFKKITSREVYYEVIGHIDVFEKDSFLKQDPLYLGSIKNIAELCKKHDIEEIIIALPYGDRSKIINIIEECQKHHINWKIVPDSLGVQLENIQLFELDDIPLLGARGTELEGINLFLKSTMDKLFSAILIILSLPLLIISAACIKLDSPGPVLHKQKRIGRKGKPFIMYKLRTMYSGADETEHRNFVEKYINGENKNLSQNDIHKLRDDKRITKIGGFLRKFSIDELPQFCNVFKGDMSVVGPRPAIDYEVEKYSQWQKRRLNVRPGITGLWQVGGRNRLLFDEGVRLDLQYIDNWSFELDFKIMLKTVWVVFFRRER